MRYKLITLAAAAIASSATAAAAKERIVDVTTLDVAGVRLGMFPDEARIGLEAAGFKVSDDRSGPSWTAPIAEEAGKYVNRSAERRVWKESVRTLRSRWSR